MCLVTTWKEPLIATRDIECYKVIEREPGCDWHTPYRHMRIVPGERYTCNDFQKTTIEPCLLIETGFHSFFFRADARVQALDLLQKFPHIKYAFIKCKIPAGSKYWEGKFGVDPCYCSESIIYCTDDFVEIN